MSADSAWLEYGRYIIELKERGYISLHPDASKPSDIRYEEGDFKNNPMFPYKLINGDGRSSAEAKLISK